jgi:hypothetical protein
MAHRAVRGMHLAPTHTVRVTSQEGVSRVVIPRADGQSKAGVIYFAIHIFVQNDTWWVFFYFAGCLILGFAKNHRVTRVVGQSV